MLVFLFTMLLVVGFNTILWIVAAAARMVAARVPRPSVAGSHPEPSHVAIVIAAHNEELVIEATIRSAGVQVPMGNVFVVSDGSTDQTVRVASEAGATVLDLQPNRGKAGAIAAIVKAYELPARYEVLMLLDADTQLSPNYLRTGLPLFSDPGVVAVAGRVTTLIDPRPPTRMGRLLVAYRERLYLSVQYLQKFGQAARYLNAVSIVPGFASMYRTRILSSVDIAAPGLVIEDFNMTFEVHAKRLGRIAFHPGAAVAFTQDPDNLHDYVRQVRRWSLGFWQTVRRHGLHRGRFWALLVLSTGELVTSSILMTLLFPLIVVSVTAGLLAASGLDPTGTAAGIVAVVPPLALVLGFVIPDLMLSLFAAVVSRRPGYLFRWPIFPFLRVLDAVINLRAMFDAFVLRTDGRWSSPTRRLVSTES